MKYAADAAYDLSALHADKQQYSAETLEHVRLEMGKMVKFMSESGVWANYDLTMRQRCVKSLRAATVTQPERL